MAEPTFHEIEASKEWAIAHFASETSVPPVSFMYGGKSSADLLKGWWTKHSQKKLDENRTEHILTITDPGTGLEARVTAIIYNDFPAVEWVVHFRNTGTSDTPILEGILPFDTSLSVCNRDPILRYAKGALCCIDDFAPAEKRLEPKDRVHLQPGGGRSSSEIIPFFNVELDSEGLVIAIGWTGEWAATFSRDEDSNLRLQAGMALTHLKLHPAEEIRTPRILTLFWQGQNIKGNNMLRRLILTHHRPKPNGEPLNLPIIHSSWGHTAAVEHLKDIKRIIEYDLPIECYWIDAGWFGQGSWWDQAGNWQIKADLYPQGFKPISDLLHQSGRQLLLWVEPQRVCENTPWYEFRDRSDWLLDLGNGEDSYKQWKTDGWPIPHEDPRWQTYESRRSQMNKGEWLFNMGNPDALSFLTDFISSMIDEFGLDWYREDANIAPLEYWRYADKSDRQGITEIRYIEGLYAFWDELLQRHPHLKIDNCASGGRRIDLESISRSTALHRTDWAVDSTHVQCHSYGLFHWIPLHMAGRGAVLRKDNGYEIRSVMTAGLMTQLWEQDGDEMAQDARKMLEQYRNIQGFYYGDYYPLTPYSQDNDAWIAWQFDCPEMDAGMVQAFRRERSVAKSACLNLSGLDPNARYMVKNIDAPGTEEMTGSELMDKGLDVHIEDCPGAAIITYKKVR